jgi:uncharacterized protein (DUF4415 family)
MDTNSKINLRRFNASNVPPLTDKFFASAKWRTPKNKVRVVVELEPEIARWYKSHGEHYQDFLAVALRAYAEEHRSG